MSFYPQFYRCQECGQIVSVIKQTEAPLTCCGKHMVLLIPNSTDGAGEKHVPVVTQNENNIVVVKIGSVMHPMTDEHHIEWIYLLLDNGGQRRILSPGDAPEVTFNVKYGKPVAALAYCNLHGLWKSEI